MARVHFRFKPCDKVKTAKMQRALDRFLLASQIFWDDQTLALYTFLLYAETIADQDKSRETRSVVSSGEIIRYAAFLISTYGRHAPPQNLLITNALWRRAGELFNRLEKYTLFSDLMLMLFAGHLSIRKRNRRNYELKFGSFIQAKTEAMQRFWGGPESLIGPSRNVVLNKMTAQIYLARCAPHSRLRDRRLQFSFDEQVLKWLLENTNTLLQPHWHFDSTWDLGGYTVAEFREVWMVLLCIALVQRELSVLFAHSVDDQVAYLDQKLKTETFAEWQALLTRLTGIDAAMTGQIINDLTFSVNDGDKADKTVMSVFFDLGAHGLILSKRQIISADPEETIARIIGVRKKLVSGALGNFREARQTERISALFPASVETYPNFKIVLANERSNLDLLLVDRRARFLVACELKWPLAPHWFRSSDTTRKLIEKGTSQADLAVRWLRTAPQAVIQRTGLNAEELRNFEIRPLVISNRALGGSLVESISGVPIVNELMLAILLAPPINATLCDLWKTAADSGFTPVKDRDFEIRSKVRYALGEINFELIGIEALPLRRFLESDIVVSRCQTDN